MIIRGLFSPIVNKYGTMAKSVSSGILFQQISCMMNCSFYDFFKSQNEDFSQSWIKVLLAGLSSSMRVTDNFLQILYYGPRKNVYGGNGDWAPTLWKRTLFASVEIFLKYSFLQTLWHRIFPNNFLIGYFLNILLFIFTPSYLI